MGCKITQWSRKYLINVTVKLQYLQIYSVKMYMSLTT